LKGVRLFKVDSRAPIEIKTEAMAKIDATHLAFPFSLHPWGYLLIKPRRIRLFPVGSSLAMAMTSSNIKKSTNDAIHNALGLPIVFLRKAQMMPFTTRLVWPASNGYNAQPTELNIAKSRVLQGSFIFFDKSGSFSQLGVSNHSGWWKDFQSKIRLAVKTGRTQRCMMWHA
jgi:hypothetical protein